jgi:hypothetical protein
MKTRAGLLDILDEICDDAPSEIQWNRNRISHEFANVSDSVARPAHAKQTLLDGQREMINLGGHKIVLATRLVDIPSGAHVLLVLAHADVDIMFLPQMVIDGAWRLYGTDEELQELVSSPRLAFATLLDRHGMRFDIEGEQLLWLPMMLVSLTDEEREDPYKVTQRVMRGLGFEDISQLPKHAFIARVGTGEDGRMIVAGPVMINLESYRAEIERHR